MNPNYNPYEQLGLDAPISRAPNMDFQSQSDHSDYSPPKDANNRLHSPDSQTPVYDDGETTVWCRHGRLHNSRGPARVSPAGEEYALFGIRLTKGTFLRVQQFAKERNVSLDSDSATTFVAQFAGLVGPQP